MSSNVNQLATLQSANAIWQVLNTPLLFNNLLLGLAQKLNSVMTSKDSRREVAFSKAGKLTTEHSGCLAGQIATAQQPLVSLLPTLTSSDLNTKKEMLVDINEVLGVQSKVLAVIDCALINAKKKLGACQEFSFLAFAYLVKFASFHEHRLEIVSLVLKADRHINHELLVLNRALDSEIVDVSSWGGSCQIFDPLGQELYDIDSIPVDVSLSNLTQYKADSLYDIDVEFDNDFAKRLQRDYQDTVFAGIAEATTDALCRYFNESIKDLASLGLNDKLIKKIYINGIKAKLVALTALDPKEVKVYKQGQVCYLGCESLKQAKEIADLVKAGDCMDVVVNKIKTTGQNVVVVKDIDVAKLLNLEIGALNERTLGDEPPACIGQSL